jgi:predicted NUDIX family NTP pyrophosphohydrolase
MPLNGHDLRMTVRSAGLLLYRRAGGTDDGLQVLLAHMGGPYWQRKDAAAWSIPKGEHAADEEPLAAARREFTEELGLAPPDGADYVPLGEVVQRGGKVVTAWAVEADVDVRKVVSNTFEIEWPPRSGRRQEFPEIDRAEWFGIPVARLKIVQGQLPLLDRLTQHLTR